MAADLHEHGRVELRGLEPPDFLHAMQVADVRWSVSPQVAGPKHAHRSALVRAGCCTLLLYRSEGFPAPPPLTLSDGDRPFVGETSKGSTSRSRSTCLPRPRRGQPHGTAGWTCAGRRSGHWRCGRRSGPAPACSTPNLSLARPTQLACCRVGRAPDRAAARPDLDGPSW
jgi:hypothetical protein